MRLAGVRAIEGAAAHGEQTHERRQAEGGEEGEERRSGVPGGLLAGQEQKSGQDQG